MNWFSKPKRVETGDVAVNIIITLVICFLAPVHFFEGMNVNWLFGLMVLFPIGFVVSCLASRLDPAFYIRAYCAMISGVVAWPLCLLFRPVAADFASIIFTFSAGPVAAFHFLRRNDNRNR